LLDIDRYKGVITLEEFSLEKIAEKIHHNKTKEYFKEVLSSYYNGNYRSAVVMLWSVCVCDLIYKLQHLVDLHSDSKALSILTEITSIQNNDPRSSAWEIKLLDEAFEKTNFINNYEYENLRYIQKQRHLSAHPVLNHDRELYFPNKETVRSLLRNALEGLLIKPPFYAQKILSELLEDIAENTLALNTRKKVKQYVESRYLSRMTPDVELSIYRSLWKFVFKREDENSIKNRLINLKTLEIISDRNKEKLPEKIHGECDYYSNIAATGLPVAYLTFYLSRNSNLYKLLSEDAKLKIQYCVENDDIGKTAGWFVKESLAQHYRDLEAWFSTNESLSFEEGQIEFLLDISDTEEWQEYFCKLMSTCYTVSNSYNQADARFTQLVSPHMELFNINALTFLLSKIEVNNQVYGRSKSSTDHIPIKERILELAPEFDFSQYPRFQRTVES